MPIIIKEIQVKASVLKSAGQSHLAQEEKERMKQEILRELKDYMRKEQLRNSAR